MTEECNNSGDYLFWGLFIGIVISLVLFGLVVGFESPVNKLDLDEEDLARYHVLNHYPEYENCSIKYLEPWQIECKEKNAGGVKVYCDSVSDRDGMDVLVDSSTVTLCFNDLDLEDVVKDIVKEQISDKDEPEGYPLWVRGILRSPN